MRKRDIPILFRLNESEKKKLDNNCKLSGLPRERYLRQLVMQKEIKPKPTEPEIKILRELSAIGNNVNQLAHKANCLDTVDSLEIQKLSGALDRVWEAVRDL